MNIRVRKTKYVFSPLELIEADINTNFYIYNILMSHNIFKLSEVTKILVLKGKHYIAIKLNFFSPNGKCDMIKTT